MNGKEARQSFAGDDWSAQHQVDERRSDERHSAHDGSADAKAPVRILVEAQHLPVNAIPSVISRRKTPTIQVSSRGNL
jgi:hypothetical protein